MTKSDILQDISVELSKSIKKHLQHIKQLPTTDKKDIEKLIGNFKNGLDDLSEGISKSVVTEAAQLVDDKTGKAVKLPYKTKDFRGNAITVKSFTEPNNSSSSGRIQTDKGEFFPGVAGVKIVGHKFESVNEVSEEEDVVEEGRASAKSLLQSVIKGESSRIEGIKLSKEAAEGLLNWLMVSPYGKKFPNQPFHMLLKASFNWGLSRYVDKNSKEYKDLQAAAKTLGANESVNEGKNDFMARGLNTNIMIKNQPNKDLSEKLYYALIDLMKKEKFSPNEITIKF